MATLSLETTYDLVYAFLCPDVPISKRLRSRHFIWIAFKCALPHWALHRLREAMRLNVPNNEQVWCEDV